MALPFLERIMCSDPGFIKGGCADPPSPGVKLHHPPPLLPPTPNAEACPVSCIHWVEKQDLPALEFVMQKKMTERVDVGIMMSGQGPQRDVFSETYRFLKDRKRREEALANDSTKKAYSPAQEQARRCGPALDYCRLGSLPLQCGLTLLHWACSPGMPLRR